MAKLSDTWRGRAQRAKNVQRRLFQAEARIVLSAVKEGVEVELYDRTTLRTTGRMRRSIKLRYFPGGFAVVFSGAIAPHAGVRVQKTGQSKIDGHKFDMDPAAYARRKCRAQVMALKRLGMVEIAGRGAVSINGS